MTSIKEFNHNGIYMGLLILLVFSIFTGSLHTYFISSYLVQSIPLNISGPILVLLSLLFYFINGLSLKNYLKNGSNNNYKWLYLSLTFWILLFLAYFLFMIYHIVSSDVSINFRIMMIFATLAFITYYLFKITFDFLKDLKIELDRLNTLKNYF